MLSFKITPYEPILSAHQQNQPERVQIYEYYLEFNPNGVIFYIYTSKGTTLSTNKKADPASTARSALLFKHQL